MRRQRLAASVLRSALIRRLQSPQTGKPSGASSWFYAAGGAMPMEVSGDVAAASPSTKRRASVTATRVVETNDVLPTPSDTEAPESTSSSQGRRAVVAPTKPAAKAVVAHSQPSVVEQFIEEIYDQEIAQRQAENRNIAFPTHPDLIVPEFRRIKLHSKQLVTIADPEFPTFPRKDAFVSLPPAKPHPWVFQTPMGPHIVHGDGMLGVVGTGEVGFDDRPASLPLPSTWRGLQHRTLVGRPLPDKNGRVLDGHTEIRHSLSLTGRGVFATRAVKSGEVVMVVASTAQSVGMTSEVHRLSDMCVSILKEAHESTAAEDRAFLHDWILLGQPSSLLERWPATATESVIKRLGGQAVLDDLELHPIHIARLAAILDLNTFLIESSYDERRGCGYWPEAGYLNHSCEPNATYEIMPDHMFKESEFFIDETMRLDASEAESPRLVSDSQSPAADAGGVTGTGTSVVTAAPGAESLTLSGTCAVAADAASVAQQTAEIRDVVAIRGDKKVLSFANTDLTAKGAPTYLFCVRAAKDIAPGEEILISYVPPEWSFESRQYMLHDRYRFRCKCPRCAPKLDAKYARVPRAIMVVIAFMVSLQLFVLHLKYRALHVEGEDGMEPEGSTPKSGFLQRMKHLQEMSRTEALYDLGSTGPFGDKRLTTEDPMARSAR